MIGDIADRSEGANAADILKCVGSDPRVGSLCLKAGYGYGGPCFNRDNRALHTHAAAVGVDARVSIATDEYNVLHNDYQVQTILKTQPKTYTMDQVTQERYESTMSHFNMPHAQCDFYIVVLDDSMVLRCASDGGRDLIARVIPCKASN